ncbi:MAG: FdhF/YdeP family oxidoreductase, partial [Bacteroidota bacterium]
MAEQQPIHETPTEHTGLRLKRPAEEAAGLKAAAIAVANGTRYAGLGTTMKVSLQLNQKGGIDCPGCAWPDPDDDRSSIAEYCENGLKAIAEEAQKKTIGRDFFAEHSVAKLGTWSDFKLGKSGRLAEPLVLRPGAAHYEPISWEAAFELLVEELNGLDSPDEAVFYTSGKVSNEAAFAYQLFVKAFGTNNMPDCSNMCHETSGHALKNTIGIGKGTTTLQDLHESDLIIIMGQNPGTNHPRMLSALEKCKENGGKIIAVNPLKEAGLQRFVDPQNPAKVLTGGTALADLYLQVTINGDIPLLKAILLKLWHEDREQGGHLLDWDFITEKTADYEAFFEHLRAQDFANLAAASGVPRSQILEAVALLKKSERVIVCWAMGITQHENGVDNVQEIINLLLVKGAFGKPGAGACPVRGHSNVQGNRTVGVWEAPTMDFLDRLEETFHFSPPREHGLSTVPAIKAMHEGKLKVFFGLGGNFLSAAPDTSYTAEALRNCQLTAHVSTKLNRSHLVHGKTALILPALGRTELDVQHEGEQFITVENSMGIVHRSKGILEPCSPHVRSEPAIIAGLAQAVLGANNPVDWAAWANNYDHIRDGVAATVPGFEDYNRRVREQDAGFYLPNGPREGRFTTESGKAHFTINAVPNNGLSEGE